MFGYSRSPKRASVNAIDKPKHRLVINKVDMDARCALDSTRFLNHLITRRADQDNVALSTGGRLVFRLIVRPPQQGCVR